MAKRKNRNLQSFGPTTGQLFGMLLVALFLIGGLVLTMMSVSNNTFERSRAQSCNDNGCANQLWSAKLKIYMINNCAADVISCDPNGDNQLCNKAGRVGSCGGQSYCCPGSGQKWTTDMSACSGSPPYVSPCGAAPTSTPEPTPTPEPTDTPTPTPTPTPIATPTPVTYYYVPTDTPEPTDTLTPTPTISLAAACNKSCTTSTDCPGGLTCAASVLGSSCRNPFCTNKVSCLCDEGPLGQLLITPTGADGQFGSGRQINLTVSSFTNDKGETNTTPVLTGITEPGATVTVSIFPDGAGGTVVSDSTGRWTWNQNEPLTLGKKNLLVVAKKDDGQGQVAQAFTVILSKGSSSSTTLLIVLLVLGLIVGGYLYYRSKQ